MIPRSGRRRRGPGVQRPGHQRSVRLTSGRQQDDRHRVGDLTSGHRRDDRRRTSHGRRAGRLVRGRHPGMRRKRYARQAAAAGWRLWPDRRSGAGAILRAGHHRGGHPRAARRCAGGHRGNRRYANWRPADHLHAGHPHADRRCAGGRHGNHRYASWRPADRPHAGHRCADGHRGSRPYAGRPRGDWPHEGHRHADHRPGNCPPADCRWWPAHGRGGRCSRRRSREMLPGRPGRCRRGTNLACSPVRHPTGRSGPGGCRPGCFHPGCHSGHRLGPGPVRCLNPGAADWAHRCSRRQRTGRCLHHRPVPDQHSRRDPGLHRCWNGPDRGRHPPNGSVPAPRQHYGPGHPDPARLPRCCSTLS